MKGLVVREAAVKTATTSEPTPQQPDLAARPTVAEAEVKGLRELLAERDRLASANG